MTKVFCEDCYYCYRDYLGINDDGTRIAKLPKKLPIITDDPCCRKDPFYEIVPDSPIRPSYKKFIDYAKCCIRNANNDCPLYVKYVKSEE